MKKTFLRIFIVAVVFLLFAVPVYAKAKKQPKAKMQLKLDRVLVKNPSPYGEGVLLEFDLYLRRTDLKLKEPIDGNGGLSVDLPIGIQPKLMYASEVKDKNPESGTMCDRPRFPHRCSMTLSPEEYAKKSLKYRIKVTFEDGAYASKTIVISRVAPLPKPEILEPISAPEQEDAFSIKFKDVGADKYEISVALCEPYGNDGINPCLDGAEYNLIRKKGKFVIPEIENEQDQPQFSVENNIVLFGSELPLIYEEGINYYVKAISSRAAKGGVKKYLESNASKSFSVQH